MLAALLGVTPERVARHRGIFGPVLESFAVSELMKVAGWSGERLRFSHYRDKDQHEVDVVIEDRQGRMIGIDVK